MTKFIEEIIEFKPEENKLSFKLNNQEKIKSFLLSLKNNDLDEEEKKEILIDLKNIFIKYKEIAQVIISSPSFILEENIGLIELLINIFLTSEKLKESAKDLLKFLIENINFEKKYYDYIYGKLGEEHRKKSLNSQKLLNYIQILLLFYGQNIENKKFFPKKYLFFLNPSESIITTNITQENKIYLRNNFSIYFSIFIDEFSNNNNSDLIDITLENQHHLKIILSNDLIKVFYDENFLDNLEIKIELNKWINIIFSIEGNKFDKKIFINLSKICYDDLKEINKEEKINDKYNGKTKITSISFLRNFKGKLLYIFSPISKIEGNMNLIFSNLNKEKYLSEIKGKEFNFIFSPYLFNTNKFEIPSLCKQYKCYLNKPEDELYQNFIFDYHNYRKNIFMIGGIELIIPLFEFLYLFYKNNEKQEENINNEEINIEILNNLFQLIQIIIQYKKNLLCIKDSSFFKIISFFLENLPDNILDKSNFIQFLTNISTSKEKENKNELIDIEDINDVYKYIILNFKLVDKLSIENRDKYYLFISQNQFEKIPKILKFSEIIIYIKDYKIISSIMIDFLKKIYFLLKPKAENGEKERIIYLYKLFCEKYHEEIIQFTLDFTKIAMYEPDSKFTDLFKEKFRDSIICFFIQEKNICEKMKMIKLIKDLTEQYPNELNKGDELEINQLTDFLINYFRIDSFPENTILTGKDKFKVRINKKFDIFFIEWMNIYYRLIFIDIVDKNKIEEISLIDPYKVYNDDFIFGVIQNINLYIFSEKYVENILKNDFFFYQYQKLIYYQIILYDNCENLELKKKINEVKEYTFKKFKVHYGNFFMNSPIKHLKNLLFQAFLFSLREDNKDRIKENNTFELLNQFIILYKKELFDYISTTYDTKNKYMNYDDAHSIYNYIKEQIKNFISFYESERNNQSCKSDNLFLEKFISSVIISKNGELISNTKDPINKTINKLYIFYDIKTLEFLCNYFIIYFNKINIEDFRDIFLIIMIPICSNNEKKKKWMNSDYSPEIKKRFVKMFILLLKLIYIKTGEKKPNKNNDFFSIINTIIKTIHKNYNVNPTNCDLILKQSPLFSINEYIFKKTNIKLLYEEQRDKIDNNQTNNNIINQNINNNNLNLENKKESEKQIKNPLIDKKEKIIYEINMEEIIKKLFEIKYNKNKDKLIFNIPKCKPQKNADNLLKEQPIKEEEKNLENKEEIKPYKIDHSLINNKKEEMYNKHQISTIKKIKEYKRIKYDLFTWNGAYSNHNIFYNNIDKEKKILLFKKSNHLTRDYIQPLLIPMIYSYNFNEFYCQQQFFINDINDFYNIPTPNVNSNEEWSLKKLPNILKFECCLLTIENHLKGNLIIGHEFFKFIGNLIDIKKVDEANDKKQKRIFQKEKCYGSIIRSKKNCIFLKLYFNEIKFVLKRRYYDEDCGLELYTNRNKSYYLIFKNIKERDETIKILTLKFRYPIKLHNDIQKEKKTKKEEIIIGYSKIKIDINEISLKWEKRRISTLKYLIYVNIFGNRSFRDILQYPVFPWIITDYETADQKPKKEEIKTKYIEIIKNKLIENTIRDFTLPVGLMELNDKSIKRKNSYIESYISSLYSLLEDYNEEKNFPKIKELLNKFDKPEQKKETINILENDIAMSALEFSEIIKVISEREKKENKTINISEYGFTRDIYNYFSDLSKKKKKKLDIIMLPSLFGSHYSNSAYVSHFLTRIFPYSKTAIEIQGNHFDSPDRLFINLEKTFKSVSGEKSDVREPIPEFFYFPEMFLNINNLNLGILQKTKNDDRKSTVNITRSLYYNKDDDNIQVKNVFLPYWCKNNPYLFITLYRGMLEKNSIKIGSWIDLFFGINSNGINAQNNLNLYLRYSYPYVISQEILSCEDSDKETLIKMAELGMNPIQVFFDNCKNISVNEDYKSIIYNLIELYQKNFITYRNVNNFLFNDKELKRENVDFFKNHLSNTILTSSLNEYILYSGLINGETYIYNKNTNELNILENKQKKDISRITAYNYFNPELDTKYLYLGTERGSIIIYKREYVENKIKYHNIIHPHLKEIISINSNINLNILISSSYDGFIHLYTIPSLKIFRSIYFNPNDILIEQVFLSSTPLSCFLLYSNEKELICYSINGEKICNFYNEDDFIFPGVYTGNNFIDYLIYKSNENTNNIIIRQFPYLGIIEEKLNE